MQKAEESKAITKDTIIGELVEKYPQLIEPLMGFGVHCVGCHVSPFETIEMGFKGHGMTDEDVEAAVLKLNEVLEKNPASTKKKKEQKVDLSNAKVELTEKAASKLKEILEQEKKKALRIAVMPGGCSGFQYSMELDDNSTKEDIVIDEKGVKVFVDKSSMAKLDGANIDYIESLQGAGFKISNPNAKSTCGCGSSFG